MLFRSSYADSTYRLQKVQVIGSASPEGSISFNKLLSEKRAKVLFDYLSRYGSFPDFLKNSEFLGRDWNGLIQLVERDDNVPYKEETLTLLKTIALQVENGVVKDNGQLERIKRLRGGEPYQYMYKYLFPELRASRLYLWYDKVWNPVKATPVLKADLLPLHVDTVIVHDTVYISQCPPCRPFYMGVKTNILFDALLVPNIGVEFYLGKRWSVAANWMYAWWRHDGKHNYWRIYGGDIEVRHWFGRRSEEKPLQGHHVGLYGGLVTYDIEHGGRGYMGGKPGGTLFDKGNWFCGLSYGYSMPIARRLNIDFTIGFGYLGGEYREYIPVDNCYVWQATKQRHWFGPTKAEVSLVWLIGCDNKNWKKGGKR